MLQFSKLSEVTNSVIKMVDARGGQGIEVQPKYRFGAECWDALSVVPVFSAALTNPVAGTGSTLFLRGIGSRAIPNITATPGSGALALSTTTYDAVIYYTTDGSIPSANNGTTYSSTISTSSSTTYKAVSFKNGTYSDVVTYTTSA